MYKVYFLLCLCCMIYNAAPAQTGSISGSITANGHPAEFAQIHLDATNFGAVADFRGKFTITGLLPGTYQMTVSFLGFRKESKTVEVAGGTETSVNLDLTEQVMQLEDVVVTGTKTHKRQTHSAVIVNMINSESLSNVQACNLAEGLKFQPGLRVETDCQTCNYTQLRMNGLPGGYSQILINGRPVFSPLTGLYGMEQLPVNMIDRIEVVRGGGSSLYGSSAIGGTVNVITRIPTENTAEINYSWQNIKNQSGDHTISAISTVLAPNENSGISVFLNHRQREFYDANSDNFSELPLLKSNALGAAVFFLPTKHQKLDVNVSFIHEYRYGGEMVPEKPAYLALQSEERTHNIWMASADYQINFNDYNSSLITYLTWQDTQRDHYTGIIPEANTSGFEEHFTNPPYGISDAGTINAGLQLNHRLLNFAGGINTLTLGAEYIYDSVLDQIEAYDYLLDQTTKNTGAFVQSDWEISPNFTLLSGLRLDIHNLLKKPVLNPRASLLYKIKDTQFRLCYGTGFRAPQSFDTDMHIAFAGGGISRISLSPGLVEERSESFSASINYDKPMEKWIAGFTLEWFYNRLNDAFILQPVGSDQHGNLFEKQNGNSAIVQGLLLEFRANLNRKIQLESSFTVQSARYGQPATYIDGLPKKRNFMRTPSRYGNAILTWFIGKNLTANLNYVYTGSMEMPHFAGAPEQMEDEFFISPSFSDVSSKIELTLPSKQSVAHFQVYAGVKNMLDAYQQNFDRGKNRDSNFIYGPALPRSFFVGVRLTTESKN